MWELKSREGYSIGTWGIGDSKSHLIESHRCRNWIASYRDSFVTIHQPEDKKRRRRRRIDLHQIRSSARISLSASFSRRKSIGIREIHRFDRASTRSEFIVDAISSSRRALREGEGSLPGNVYARSIIYDKLQPSNLLGGISRDNAIFSSRTYLEAAISPGNQFPLRYLPRRVPLNSLASQASPLLLTATATFMVTCGGDLSLPLSSFPLVSNILSAANLPARNLLTRWSIIPRSGLAGPKHRRARARWEERLRVHETCNL